MKAVWKGVTLAESDRTIEIEGNQYFPPESVRRELLRPTETTSVCPWKGTARYYSVVADGAEHHDAAWSYPDPKEAASHFKDYVAFWRGVEIQL